MLDSTRRRLVVIGGATCIGPLGIEVWGLPLDSVASAEPIAWSGVPPTMSEAVSAAYDPMLDRILCVAGAGSNEVWELGLGDSPRWRRLPIAGPTPSGRSKPAVAFDLARNRMILVGGMGLNGIESGVELEDAWVLSIGVESTWRRIEPAGGAPSTTARATLSYDPTRDRVLLFGGLSNNLMSLNLSGSPVWSVVAPAGGGGDIAHGTQDAIACFDTARQRLLYRGGWDGTSYPDSSTWEFRFSGALTGEWRRLLEAGARPTLTSAAGAVLDPLNSRWIVYGGYGWGGWECQTLGEIRALPLASAPTWQDLVPEAAPPIEQLGVRAFLDRRRNRLVLFPGRARLGSAEAGPVLTSPMDDRLRWSVSNSPVQPAHVFEGIAVLDSLDDRLLTFGGFRSEGGGLASDTVWEYSLGADRWQPLEVSGEHPASRGAASALLDPSRARVLMFGGLVSGSDGSYEDTGEFWVLDLLPTPAWRSVVSPMGMSPGPRSGATMALDRTRRRAILFGGSTQQGQLLPEVWTLDLDTLEWTRQADDNITMGLQGNEVIEAPDEDALYVVGAYRAFALARCRLSDLTWTELGPVGGQRVPRSDRTTGIYDSTRHRIIAFHGSGAVPEPWEVDLTAAQDMKIDHAETMVDSVARLARLWWVARDAVVDGAWLDRRVDGDEWVRVGWIAADANGMLAHTESVPSGGGLYEFALQRQEEAAWGSYGVTSFHMPAQATFALDAAPNPAFGEMVLRYSVPGPSSSEDRLEIFDVLGRRVAQKRPAITSGLSGTFVFNQQNAARPGMYFARLSRGSQVLAKRSLVILR